MRTMLTLVAMLALVGSASAAMSLTWTATPNVAPGLDKYVGTLTTDAGKTIQALDLGAAGITGTLNQVKLMGSFDTVYETFSGMASDPLDTHFLLEAAEVVEGVVPTESTAFIKGALGIRGAYQAQSVDFVQLIVPSGSTIFYDMTASDGALNAFEGQFPVPEPATLGLLALGVLGLLRRR